MRLYDFFQHLPYTFEQVSTVFWHRYPNSASKHIISEDVIEIVVDGDKIKTKKLILKQTGTFLKKIPKWMSRLTDAKVVPTVEESIFDRSKRLLVTYTRNISMMSICKIHERCIYKPGLRNGIPETVIERAGLVSTSFKRCNNIIERVLMANFKKNMRKTFNTYMEKLTLRYGEPTSVSHGIGRKFEHDFIKQRIAGS